MDNRDPCWGPAIAEVIASGRYRHALLTTYALSLSYLESELIAPLIRSGCDDIWVIADAHGYRSSLLERRASRVGLEYRLVPAALANGVLHAKCIYLAGDEGDRLLIGSGNLTFGGHGRNLEVFELLVPERHPTAFDEFAAFIETVVTAAGVLLPRNDWAELFAELARAAAARVAPPGTPTVQLLHSLDRPIAVQLGEIAAAGGGCSRIVVQSPYHDPDGAGVRSLIESSGAGRCDVAMPARGRDSPFPFAAAKSWPQKVAPVRADSDDHRFSHAKYYELHGRRAKLLFTGSANATSKALAGTDNIELGIVRFLTGSEPLPGWRPDEAVPGFAPQLRRQSGLGSHEIVFAAFDRTDPEQLTGKLISLQPVSGTWTLLLVDAGGDSVEAAVEVTADGAFDRHCPDFARFAEAFSVQLVLSRDGREARGWVHNEMILSVGSRRRLTGAGLLRLTRGMGLVEDAHALLDYLAVYAHQHLVLFSRPIIASGAGDGGREAASVAISLRELVPGSEPDPMPGEATAAGQSGDARQLDLAMARLRKFLLGEGRPKGRPIVQPGGGGLESGGEDEGDPTPPDPPDVQAARLGLPDFEERMKTMITDAAERPPVRDALLVMLVEISLAMRLHRLRDPEGALEFLREWLELACSVARAGSAEKTALVQHVVTSAIILAASEADETERARTASEVHGRLESFYGGTVDPADAAAMTIDDADAGFFSSLVPNAAGESPQAILVRLLATPTQRRQMEMIARSLEGGEPVPDDLPAFATVAGARLLAALRGRKPERRINRSPFGFGGCAFRYCSFAAPEAADFARERIGYCIHCQKFTINTEV